MLEEAFFEKLKESYAEKEALEAFASESPVLREALAAIERDISSVYKIVEPIRPGGAGIVIRVSHRKTGIDYALKLPRPRGQAYLDTVKEEIGHLIKIRHENIMSIHYMGEVAVRAWVMGVMSTGYAFSGLAGPVLVWLIGQQGWRGTLIIVGIVVWVVGIPLGLVIRHRREPS